MSWVPSDEIVSDLQELISKITGLENKSQSQFRKLEHSIMRTVRRSSTMYFFKEAEMQDAVQSMCDKYLFHGFEMHGRALKQAYLRYVSGAKNMSEQLTMRLNVVKMLLALSYRPTHYFAEHPDEFADIGRNADDLNENAIDWAQYLNEGIEPCVGLPDNSNSYNTDDEEVLLEENWSDSSADNNSLVMHECSMYAEKPPHPIAVIPTSGTEKFINIQENLNALRCRIQHGWYYQPARIMEEPVSKLPAANTGIRWDNMLRSQTGYIIPIPQCAVISEYKVMREVIWQMFGVHTSTVFRLAENRLVVRDDLTIASLRSCVFSACMEQFLQHINLMDDFRQFFRQLNDECLTIGGSNTSLPHTVLSYGKAIEDIVRATYPPLYDLERLIADQMETMTLLKLIDRLNDIMEPVVVLKRIHDAACQHYRHSTFNIANDDDVALKSAVNLLVHLHDNLQLSATKLEQDLRLTLFLASLYHYMTVMDWWLVKNSFCDPSHEFFIQSNATANNEHTVLVNRLKLIENSSTHNNTFLHRIAQQVLDIGRNLHLLRAIDADTSMTCDSLREETIHEEFVRKLLDKIRGFSRCTVSDHVVVDVSAAGDDDSNDELDANAAIKCPDDQNKDLCQMFLDMAFEDFDMEHDAPPKLQSPLESCLFQRVQQGTSILHPFNDSIEMLLGQMLADRFSMSGLMVKRVLMDQYGLGGLLSMLQHVFLLWNDHMCHFYQHLFELLRTMASIMMTASQPKTESSQCVNDDAQQVRANAAIARWGNSALHTARLHDIIMDAYPNWYHRCWTQVDDSWRQCTGDALLCCQTINIMVHVQWPLNLIVTNEQMLLYQGIFRVLLQLKWALSTVNGLYFGDLNAESYDQSSKAGDRPLLVRGSSSSSTDSLHKLSIHRQRISMQIKCLRFHLINTLYNIQHYLCGYAIARCVQSLTIDMERASDFQSLVQAHSDFLRTLYTMVNNVCHVNHPKTSKSNTGFQTILQCVRLIALLWGPVCDISMAHLRECIRLFKMAHSQLYAVLQHCDVAR